MGIRRVLAAAVLVAADFTVNTAALAQRSAKALVCRSAKWRARRR